MNEVVEYESIQLPDTLEDLTQFVLVGKAKLQAYMLKLQTVNKLSVAQEIRDQTLKEAQEISTALIAAEQRIGELLLTIPKAQGFASTIQDNGVQNVKTKTEAVKEMGYSEREAKDYQQMAKNPEIVQKVIDEAIANGEVVTKTQVLKEIKAERDKIKAEMTDLKEERDYLQSQVEELQNADPKVVTKTVEKVPADYESLKEKAKLSDSYKKDFSDMRKRYDEMADKWKKAEAEKNSIISEMNRPENEKAENIKRSALFFCAGVSNFIEKYGGYIWLTQEISNMEESERIGYIKAVNAIEAWAAQMKANMEGIIE